MVGEIALAALDLLGEGLLDFPGMGQLATVQVEFDLAVGRSRTRKLFLVEVGNRQMLAPVFLASRSAA